MLINWFTVIAQIINFLILVLLLRRFLFKPILKAVEEREKRIAEQLNDAEQKKAEATKERDEFQKKNEDFDLQRNQHWQKAVEEIKTERFQLLDQARKDSDDLRAKLEKALQDQQQDINLTIARKTQEEVFALARKTLLELADENLEERMTNVFIDKLKDQDKEQIKKMTATLSSHLPLTVSSAFELPAIQKEKLENTIKQLAGNNVQLNYKTAPDIISGIELKSNGYKLSWSISDHLNSIEKIIEDTISQRSAIVNPEDTGK